MRNETFLLRNARAETIGPYKTDTVAYLKPKPKKGGKRKTKRRRHKSKRKTRKNKNTRGGLSADDLEAEIRSEIFKYPGESRTPERVEELLGFAEDDFNIDELANGYTLLSLAASYGRLGIVNVLLQNGADPNGANGANWPLRKASENGHLDVVKRLLEVGANPNQTINDTPDFGSHSLAVAAKAGHADVVEVLLEKNAHVRHLDVFGRSSIWHAIDKQNYDIAKRLIRAAFLQAPVNGDVYTEENATQDRVLGEENPDVEEYFYKINAIYNQDNDSDKTLHPILKDDTASYLGGKRKTRTPRKTRKNKKGGTVTNDTRLLAFTKIGNKNKVIQLIEKGADVNAPTAYGNGTALFEAIQYNHKDIVKILIENGADVNKVRNDGVTPLILAIQYNNTEIIKILLNAGANTDKPDSLPAYGNDYGREVLNMAEVYANKKNMRMIKEHIVDKNLQNIKKRQDDRILLVSVMDKGVI